MKQEEPFRAVAVLAVVVALAAATSEGEAETPAPPYRTYSAARATVGSLELVVKVYRAISPYDSAWIQCSIKNRDVLDLHLLRQSDPVVFIASKGQTGDGTPVVLTDGPGMQRSLVNHRARSGEEARAFRADLRAYRGRFEVGVYTVRVMWSATLVWAGSRLPMRNVRITSPPVKLVVRAMDLKRIGHRPGGSPVATLTLLPGNPTGPIWPWQEGAVLTNNAKYTIHVPYFRKEEDAQGRVTLVTQMTAWLWCPGNAWVYTERVKKQAEKPKFYEVKSGASVALRSIVPQIDGAGVYYYETTFKVVGRSTNLPENALTHGASSRAFIVLHAADAVGKPRKDSGKAKGGNEDTPHRTRD